MGLDRKIDVSEAFQDWLKLEDTNRTPEGIRTYFDKWQANGPEYVAALRRTIAEYCNTLETTHDCIAQGFE